MARVLIVPGLAVRTYAEPATAALAARGHDAELLPAPGWRGVDSDLTAYGRALAERIEREGPVDLLVGLSVGTQAAAVAAAATDRVASLLLASPTVDPEKRTWPRLISAWVRGDPRADDPPMRNQAADWVLAGVPRLLAGFGSALTARPLEDVVPEIGADLTVVHAEYDSVGGPDWAAEVADRGNGRLLLAAGAPHSWPYRDTTAFADLVDRLVA